MDSRIALANGAMLRFTNAEGGAVAYMIAKEIGRGGSCIVYDATYETNTGDIKHVRIKECYPCKLRIKRTVQGYLQAMGDDAAHFEKAQQTFRSDFSLGNGLFYSGGLFDALTNTIDIYSGYGTVYLASEFSTENTLASYRPKDLKSCISIVKQVACILQKIHDEGYLYLDVKPDNILVVDSYTTRVQLFDLDSLIPMALIHSCDKSTYNGVRLSYTRGFAAIELQTAKFRRLGAHTDVYGVGALLFWLLFGRAPTTQDSEHNAEFDYSQTIYADSEHQDRLYFALTEFFHNALAVFCMDRFQSMRLVVDSLEKIEVLADNSKPYIRSTEIISPEIFVGRKNELDILCRWVEESESKCIFVTGMGGIGKSTLVRFALSKGNPCLDSILYLSFDESLPKTISDDRQAFINTVTKSDTESSADYYERKLREFSKIAAITKTVLVIDNYPGELNIDLQDILNVGWKVVFISRKEPASGDNSVLTITAMSERSELHSLFEQNVKKEIQQAEIPYIDNIIKKAAGHTLTVELIAKQIASSYLTIAEASALVDEYGFSGIASEKVVFCKDNIEHTETIRGIITALFKADRLSEIMKDILKTMSLIGGTGVDILMFQSMVEIETVDEINALIRDGWIQLSGRSISLHPVIKETIHCWEWSDGAKQYATRLLEYLFRELRIEGHKEDYPKKLSQIIEHNNEQFQEHPKFGKWFEKLTDKKRVIVETVRDRYARTDTVEPTDRERVALLVSLAEGVLNNCKREPLFLETDLYLDLLYCTVQNMPRYREDFILDRAEELIRSPKCQNEIAIMKLYGYILGVYLERKDFGAADEKLREAGQTAKRFGSSYVYALYHDMLSDYYDYVLGGAYVPQDPDEELILHKLINAINKTISYSRRTKNPEGKQLLAKNLLVKATIIIRNSPGRKKQIDRLIDEARKIIVAETQSYSEVRSIYYMVCAWYFTLVAPSLECTEDFMAKASEISARSSPTDLDEIDCITIPCADMYCLWECYDRSAKLILDAVDICERNEPVIPYIRKKLELYGYLLDVCCEWGRFDLCMAIISEIDTQNDKYRSIGIHKEISEELRDHIALSE